MTYKDKDKQREAQRERTRRYRAKQKGVTSEGVTPEGATGLVIPTTIEQVKALTPDQAKAILNSWAEGKGTEYQRRLGLLAQCYGQAIA